MSASKHIDRICAAAAALSVLLCLLFMNGAALGIQPASRTMGYEARLFDTSRVHTIDIVMDGWDSFLETCDNEEYSACAVVIDGEGYKNIGIRAKGNTSLSTVSQLDSGRYSFKLEFDCYDSGKSYYGLDKLCLNNLIQDNTCMKDYLAYRMMARFGVAAPLCNYVYITVNGEDWGLYLAVEGVEEAFLQRNYGKDSGELYKPDSMSFGGGRGNGKGFNMDDFMNRDGSEQENSPSGQTQMPEGFEPPFAGGTPPVGFDPSSAGAAPPVGFDPSSAGAAPPEGFDPADRSEGGGSKGGFGFGGGMFGGGSGMGSDDVKLKYIDDDPDSYANIFDSAKTDVNSADKARLIQSLKTLGEGGDVSGAVDADAVLRYFAVHNFLVNGDSYTGAMVHNYYLYEKDGLLSMIPWDYNLAFGTFQGGDTAGAVNDPIDSPLSVSGSGDRPMADWIFQSEESTRLYHQYFREFLDTVDPAALIEEAAALIAPYVERDPTKFCTYEEFEAGVAALKTFCTLRAESVSGQLAGTIPSTSAGQRADSSALVDASGLTLSDMGTMNQGRGGFMQQGGGSTQQGDSFPQGGGFPAGNFGRPGQTPAGGMPGQNGGTDASQSIPQPIQGAGPSGSGQNRGGDRQRPSGGSLPAGSAAPENNRSQAAGALTLLTVSVLVLAAGLVAAFQFKRTRKTPSPAGTAPG